MSANDTAANGETRPVETAADDAVELARLRGLVGPSEVAYAAAIEDRDATQRVARDAVLAAGELRGQIEEMRVQLARARQDQDVLLRQSRMTTIGRGRDHTRRWWAQRARPQLGRLRRIPSALNRRRKARSA